MSDAAITKRKARPPVLDDPVRFDWGPFDAMTDDERHAAAVSDPDAQPWTEEQLANAKPIPRTITMRRAFRLTQEQFAEQFAIPIGTLRDWEQRRKEPDAAARAYLRVIAAEPDMVRRVLGTGRPEKG
jgi:putative transcriptional regulator